MRDTTQARARLLADWARYLQGAARQGTLTGKPIRLRSVGIAGPRAGALELYAGEHAVKVLRALAASDAALLRQFIPWSFPGEPACYMSGRYIRIEAGWPEDLAETMIRLGDLSKNPERGGRWVAGKNETGATVVMGLNDRTPHYLVSGATGSGKSVALRSAVLQLSGDPDNRLVLCDGKYGEGLGNLAHLPGVVGPVATDGPAARAALAWTCAQMRQRYTEGATGRLVLVVDEFQEWAEEQAITDLLRKLAAQGRAAGVHCLLATQHPTISAFGDPATRRNLSGKLALRVSDPDASRVAVGGATPRADYLLGAGDAYAVGPGAVHRIQAAYVDNADFDAVGAGQWDFETWEEDAESIGQDLPAAGRAPGFGAGELAGALIAAVEGMGRPALVRWLESVDLGRPGSDRAARLLALGREVRDWLNVNSYDVCQIDGDEDDEDDGEQ